MSDSFARLGLAPELVRAVTGEGYAEPTPVQAQAIPFILAGRDVLAGAQTGTGKTAGFTLPLLQRLAVHGNASPSPAKHPIRALIITPTRELAAQVEESVRTYGKHMPLRSTLVYGGVGISPQIDALRRGVDILVATPGRLLDHMQQKTVDLRHVQILVLDEADRMLDMGFIRDIRRILAALPPKRQNLLFSATFSDEIRELAESLLHDPAQVQVARRNADSELVAQRVHPVAQSHKRALLAHLVLSGDWHQVLVFTRTKHGANRLAEQLCKDGVEATAIHGNKSQGARTKALAGFKDGSVRVLVATDLASRGLDIEELPHVVNYELPHVPEDYVHRIGRTGRAGSTGEAISLVAPEENGLLADIEKLLKRKLVREAVPGFEPGTASPPQEPPARREQPGRRSRDGQQRRNHAAPDAQRDSQQRRNHASPDAQRDGQQRRNHAAPDAQRDGQQRRNHASPDAQRDGQQRRDHASPDAQRGRGDAPAASRQPVQMRPIGAAHAAAPARAVAPSHTVAPSRPANQTRAAPHVPALLRGTTRRAG